MELYRGVVENNNSPNKDGRVKVRIFGIHTEKNEHSGIFENISTDHLPWAEIMGGTSFGLVSGHGVTSVLRQGTWVWVILDKGDPNKPIIIGTISGSQKVKKDYKNGEGFCDPSGVFPDRLNEHDINELTRSQIKNTVIKYKNDNLDSSPYYNEVQQSISSYPNNNVVESYSGHIIELDDTPGAERVQIIDKRGNYSEMKLNEYIDKAVNHKINIIMKNLIEHIVGGVKQQIDMDKLTTIAGYFELKADGNLQIINDVKITGNLEVTEKITANDNISSKAEVADQFGNLSSLRDAYDNHVHVGNLGVPTAIPTNTDPKIRWGDYTWTHTPLGFNEE